MTNIEGKEGKNIKMPDGIRYTCYSVCLTGVVSVCGGWGRGANCGEGQSTGGDLQGYISVSFMLQYNRHFVCVQIFEHNLRIIG